MNAIIIKRPEPVLIIFVNVICILILISCGSGGGGGGGGSKATIDNSHFYGEYAMWIRTDGCNIRYSKLTIGGDPSRACEEDYLFIPQDSNSATNSWTDEDCNLSRSITASEDVPVPEDLPEKYHDDLRSNIKETIIVSGESPMVDCKANISQNFEVELEGPLPLRKMTIEKWLELVPGVTAPGPEPEFRSYDIFGRILVDWPDDWPDDWPEYCVGNFDGRIIEEGSLGLEIVSPTGIYHANYPDPSFNHYGGWITVTEDGIPITVSEIIKMLELKDETGAVVDQAIFSDLHFAIYYDSIWNSSDNSVVIWGPHGGSGFSMHFSEGFEMPAGDCTFVITTIDDEIISKTINFPGKEENPIMDTDNIDYEWDDEGNLNFKGLKLEGEFDKKLQLAIRDEHWNPLTVTFPADTDTVVLKAEEIKNVVNYFNSTTWYVSFRVLSYTEEDVNYARSISNEIEISDFPPMF